MTQDRKATLATRMKALEERVKVLEAAPPAGQAVTAAGPALPGTPPKRKNVLKSAASLMRTMVRKPGAATGR